MSTKMVALKLSVIIFTLIVLITSIINIIFYNNATKGNCSGISTGFATFMMWVNIIFVVLTVGLFIWTMFGLFRKKPKTKETVPAEVVQQPQQPQSVVRRTTTVEEGIPVSQVRTAQEEEDRLKISQTEARMAQFY